MKRRRPMKRQPRRRDPAADEARAAFRAADGGMETRRPAMTDPTDWKQHHANEAEKAVVHPIVEDAADEFADNMGFKREGLPGHGLMKVASYAAQVARAQALGFDPELLLMSAEESDASALRLARLAAQAGKPVWLIVADGGGRGVSEGDAALRRERDEARAALAVLRDRVEGFDVTRDELDAALDARDEARAEAARLSERLLRSEQARLAAVARLKGADEEGAPPFNQALFESDKLRYEALRERDETRLALDVALIERNEARAALERITARYIAGASAGELADLAFEALGGGDD